MRRKELEGKFLPVYMFLEKWKKQQKERIWDIC